MGEEKRFQKDAPGGAARRRSDDAPGGIAPGRWSCGGACGHGGIAGWYPNMVKAPINGPDGARSRRDGAAMHGGMLDE